MKRLPSEILGEIFLYLHPKDKVDCMLVCQHWKHIIEEFALYHALEIRSATSLNKLTEIVEENPAVGKKVEHLKMYFYDEEGDFDLSGLLLLLPNIRTLLCIGPEREDLIIAEEIMYPWSRYIEYINEYSFGSITCSLLLSNICSNLTTITLDDPSRNIIHLLENAPALRNLTLCVICISFDGLDTLHENAPCLESFTVNDLTLENSEPSYYIKPAISVTECHFEEVVVTSRNLETTEKLLTYASKKYPNLSNFTYTFLFESAGDDNIEKETYSDWLPLLQNLGPKLKKLFVSNNGWTDNTSDILDRCNCQIEYLRIRSLSNAAFTKIGQSRQIYYIQTLVLCHINFETYGWLNEFQTLKKLKLDSSPFVEHQAGVELDAVIDNSPLTLRSLSLYRVRLTADPKYIGLSNIETLAFNVTELSEGIDTFISQHFPKLTNLKLKQCDVMGEAFNLEEMNLLNFTYHANFLKKNHANVLIVTSNNDERRWYALKDGNSNSFGIDNQYNTFYPSVKSKLQSETDTDPDFILLCNTLNNYILI